MAQWQSELWRPTATNPERITLWLLTNDSYCSCNCTHRSGGAERRSGAAAVKHAGRDVDSLGTYARHPESVQAAAAAGSTSVDDSCATWARARAPGRRRPASARAAACHRPRRWWAQRRSLRCWCSTLATPAASAAAATPLARLQARGVGVRWWQATNARRQPVQCLPAPPASSSSAARTARAMAPRCRGAARGPRGGAKWWTQSPQNSCSRSRRLGELTRRDTRFAQPVLSLACCPQARRGHRSTRTRLRCARNEARER